MLPTKPHHSAPCNGCGVCCIAEQCQVSVDLFGTAQLCPALEWDGDRFWCGLMRNPAQYGAIDQGLEAIGQGATARYFQSLIGSNKGCDSDD